MSWDVADMFLGAILRWPEPVVDMVLKCSCTNRNTYPQEAADETKADSTLRSSQAVPHPSTNRALCRLTSEVERVPVPSTR